MHVRYYDVLWGWIADQVMAGNDGEGMTTETAQEIMQERVMVQRIDILVEVGSYHSQKKNLRA